MSPRRSSAHSATTIGPAISSSCSSSTQRSVASMSGASTTRSPSCHSRPAKTARSHAVSSSSTPRRCQRNRDESVSGSTRMRDEMLRAACFASLDVLCAQFGDDIPYAGGLDRGFPHGGRRVPFLSTQKGIFRAAAQTGPAALSINTSSKSPYGDAEVEDGYLYAYRSGSIDQPDNRALRQAYALQVPLVYFVATRPGWYRPLYPSYIA